MGTRYEWQPWARIQASGAGLFIATAGIIGMFFPPRWWAIGNLILGLLIFAFEYPIPPFSLLGPISRNLWVRGVLYLAATAETAFFAPAITGGLCLLCASLTYMKAAYNGEQFAGSGGSKSRGKRGSKAGGGK